MRVDYMSFLNTKAAQIEEKGFEPIKGLNQNLFPFQSHIVKRALKIGRFAIFADCGLGKTLMQLEIARQCHIKTSKTSLILCPLAVVDQTKSEADKFNVDLSGIKVINYEQLKNLNPKDYGCICLDESSILKSFTGKLKGQIISAFKSTPYRFCFTATPSPNDTMEIGNHSEFLGQMKFKNMLSMYFINDMDTVQKWRIKGHAEDIFWRWVASWSICLTSPKDIGYDDKGYVLPSLNLIDHKLKSEKLDNGLLFNELSVNSTNHNQELRRTFDLRMAKSIELVNNDQPAIVWVKHNEESKYLASQIDGAKEVTGSMKDDQKKDLLLGFSRGDFRVLVTKPKIAQYGLNYQHCNLQVFASLDFSFEGTYQAIRRSYRFGQKREVNIHLITTDTMTNVIEAIKRKQNQFQIMQSKLKKYAA